jgi:hypothetical protein
MISDIYYDKPWGASSNAPRDIRNESRHGEGESLIELVLKYGVLNMLRGKAEGAPDLNLEH